MIFKSKRKISPNKLKFVSSLVLGIVIMMLVFVLTNSLMKRSLVSAEKRYVNSCSLVLEGYTNAVRFYLENYYTSLNSIYYAELFAEGDSKKIQNWIIENIPFLSEDFCTVFYIDSNNIGYFSRGDVIDLTGRPYITGADFDGVKYYVSDAYFSTYSDYPVFVIEIPYYDKNNTLRGILAAAIQLSQIFDIDQKIRIGGEGSIYIIDRNGNFVCHPMQEYMGKPFRPKQEKYRFITSDVTARSGRSIVETENEHGETVDLYSEKIKDTGWTLGVAFPKKNIRKLIGSFDFVRLLILIVSTIALFLLLFIEILISDYFYKHQLIDPVYDPLTKLWTRQKFEAEAQKLLKHNPKSKFMLIEADIRGFKFINQNYHEDVADKMIFFYSSILNEVTQEFKALIGRGYADHFYMLFKVSNVTEAMNVFKGRSYLINEKIKEYEIPFFPKFGITFCKPSYHPEITVKDLIGQAAFAKSTIKDSMLTPYSIYNARLLDKIHEEQRIEQRMKSALENQEFFLMYQPKINLADDTVVGAEALVRWRNPDLGLIYPDQFIPLFERNGFIIKLDFYVYDKVFKFLDSQIKAGKPVVPISVNMSRNHNQPDKFMFEFLRLFRKYTIPPHLVQVEILERSAMDWETLCEITNVLHNEGFTVAMDDFGSGESSLNMLAKVPVDVLKFDRDFLKSSFNEKGGMDEMNSNFIRSLIDLSRNLDKETVFEGVETEFQRDFLRSINCDQVQGYFYSRPLMEHDFINFIMAHSCK